LKNLYARFSRFRYLGIFALFYCSAGQATTNDSWLCNYKTIHDKGWAFSNSFDIDDRKKLLGPLDDYSGKRIEYDLVFDNSVGIVAIRTYFAPLSDGSATKIIGLMTVTIHKETGTFKLVVSHVGEIEEDRYFGSCKLNMRRGKTEKE
jgi:hypothetical protein